MCGRFSLQHTPEEVQEFFGLLDIGDYPPRYNIAPTQPILVVAAGPPPDQGSNLPDRIGQLMRWGLLPSWVKDPGDFPLLINARSETASDKASFRNAMRHRRAIVPASGFYEWQRDKTSGQSQAYWVRPKDGGVIGFAALCETYMNTDGAEMDTAALLTVQANSEFARIHNRMPVIINPDDMQRWLDCRTQEPRHVSDLLQSPAQGVFEAIPISDLVNKVANSSPDVQQPVTPKDLARPKKPRREDADDGQTSLF